MCSNLHQSCSQGDNSDFFLSTLALLWLLLQSRIFFENLQIISHFYAQRDPGTVQCLYSFHSSEK